MLKDERRICEVCGKAYVPKVVNQKTCCAECSAKRKAIVQKTAEKYNGPHMVKCQNPLCGKMFYTKLPKSAKYCSRKCQYAVSKTKAKRKGKVKTVCAWCGKEILVRVMREHNFCNDKHAEKYRYAKRRRMENEPRELKNSLCFDCKRASGKYGKMCSWATNFLPIQGWTAEPTPEMKDESGYIYKLASYKVTDCPEFEPDEVRHE